jgi:hypothetical protein
MQQEMKRTVQDFVERLSGLDDNERSTFTRKLFWKILEDAKTELEAVVDNLRYDFENSLMHFRDELASEMSEVFSNFYWEKVEDGFDCEYGIPVIGYFKKEKKYKVGVWEQKLEGEGDWGSFFRLEDGTYQEPSWFGPLPKIPTTEN